MALHLSQDPQADALLTTEPFALLVGMVLDQQVPLEWAFAAPLEMQRRLGRSLDPRAVAAMDPGDLAALFSVKPALHRYPGSMATRVHELSRLVVERYGGTVTDIWETAATGPELLARIKELPGFGEQKAKIFVALLGKQLGVRPRGWKAVSAPFSDVGSARSVADITGPDSLARVRAFKAELKAANKAGHTSAPATRGAPVKRTDTSGDGTGAHAEQTRRAARA